MRAHGFRVSFTPLFEVLFTFPSRYSSTVGLPVVFSLAGWSPLFHAGFLVSCATQVPPGTRAPVSPTGLSPSSAAVSTAFGYQCPTAPYGRPYYPAGASPRPRFGLLRLRSPLLAESLLFSSPAGTEMFQFPALAPPPRAVSALRTGSADHFVFADPRGFSQLVTSFLASGSHRHPPCALFRFPFTFYLFPAADCYARGGFRSRLYSCVYTMSMTSPFRGE